MRNLREFFSRPKVGRKSDSSLEILRSTDLFDPVWYRENHPDLRGKPIDAAKHYLEHGASEGRNPHPLFDTKFYVEQNPNVAASGMNPLVHYILHGRQKGRLPRPPVALDPQTVGGTISNGQVEPAPIAAVAVVPVAIPHSVISATPPAQPKKPHWLELAHERWRGLFDEVETFAEDLYLRQNNDIAEAVRRGDLRSGCHHWVNHGIVEDLLCTRPRLPGFSEVFYRQSNPDVATEIAKGVIPSGYHHFLMFGFSEGRQSGRTPLTLSVPQTYDIPSLNERLNALALQPRISVIVPVFDTDRKMLEQCIDSVRQQVYQNWELCLVDDGSPAPHVRAILLRYARQDSRIKTAFFDMNRGISAASNAALALASGSWVALLDHDDELTPDALLEVVSVITTDPQVEMIYSDEDKISADGKRYYDFNFKPAWSPELLRSHMYIGHLTAYRRSIIDRVGGFRSEFDETQDYDLALRASEVVTRVCHIPKVLYHWRAVPGSAALSIDAKPQAFERQRRALEETLARTGSTGTVTAPGAGWWRIVYDPPIPHPFVSIVIPTAGHTREIQGCQIDLVENCIRSLVESDCYDNFEIVVIENEDLNANTRRSLKQFPEVRFVKYSSTKFNFCEKLNLGVREARGQYVLLLNDDIEVVTRRFIYDMVGLANQPGIGAVGAKLLFADGRLQHVGIVMTSNGPSHGLIGEHTSVAGPQGIAQLSHNAIGATAACLLVRKDLYLAVGGFDEEFGPIYNDVDFCLKLRQRGLRIAVDPAIKLYHFESLSKSGDENWEFYLEKLLQRWRVFDDPYVNANYRRESVYFEVNGQAKGAIEEFNIAIRRRISIPRQTNGLVRFSVIVGVYNTPRQFLIDLEQSILMQSYQNFEWVIVDDASTRPETLKWLDAIATHPQVKVIKQPRNRGIMGAYGTAFRAATGDYVLPVDHDDFLTLDALAIMAQAVVSHGWPGLLYSDECKTDTRSTLIHPFHKPDWDPILFSNICYCCHLGCVRRDVAAATGCFEDEKATWSYDWDYYWRIFRAGHSPVHVPEVTYAWRIHPGSTAAVETSGKPQGVNSQRHVLMQQMTLSGWGRSLDIVPNELFNCGGMWRLRPKRMPNGICVVVDANGEFSSASFGALFDQLGEIRGLKLVLMGGRDVAEAARQRSLQVWVAAPGDFAGAMRQAACEGELVCWLGAGTYPAEQKWLVESAGLLAAIEDVVLVGGRVIGKDQRVLWAGGFFGINGSLDSPDFGLAANDGGYHGMGLCQRTVDGVPSNHWVARSSFLSSVLDQTGGHITPAILATSLALSAVHGGHRVLYTPFDLVITSQKAVRPAVSSIATMNIFGQAWPAESRYFSFHLASDVRA